MTAGHLPGDLRICFVGDSFVNGTGDPDCLGWAGRICAAARRRGHDLTYYNLGVRRETSADIAARWLDETARRLPTGVDGRVVFSFGVNDTTLEHGRPRVPPDATARHARAILGTAHDCFGTIMVGPPPTADADQNARIEALSVRLSAVSAEVGVAYLSVFAPLQAAKAWTVEAAANDGSHPAAGGYAELAELVERWAAWQAWFTGPG